MGGTPMARSTQPGFAPGGATAVASYAHSPASRALGMVPPSRAALRRMLASGPARRWPRGEVSRASRPAREAGDMGKMPMAREAARMAGKMQVLAAPWFFLPSRTRISVSRLRPAAPDFGHCAAPEDRKRPPSAPARKNLQIDPTMCMKTKGHGGKMSEKIPKNTSKCHSISAFSTFSPRDFVIPDRIEGPRAALRRIEPGTDCPMAGTTRRIGLGAPAALSAINDPRRRSPLTPHPERCGVVPLNLP
jgi:hypothetical protein